VTQLKKLPVRFPGIDLKERVHSYDKKKLCLRTSLFPEILQGLYCIRWPLPLNFDFGNFEKGIVGHSLSDHLQPIGCGYGRRNIFMRRNRGGDKDNSIKSDLFADLFCGAKVTEMYWIECPP
jgi:hypothetical protein